MSPTALPFRPNALEVVLAEYLNLDPTEVVAGSFETNAAGVVYWRQAVGEKVVQRTTKLEPATLVALQDKAQERVASISGFLLARIAEDAANVDHPFGPGSQLGGRIGWADVGAIREVLMIDEDRLLDECKAKRRIVERSAPEWVLRVLALPYADHPDYRQEWTL